MNMNTDRTKSHWRIRCIDQRFTMHSRLGLTVSFELVSPHLFSDWVEQTEQYLENTLGPAARLSTVPRWNKQGRWLAQYQDIRHRKRKMFVYRLALRDRKLLDTVLLSQGEPQIDSDVVLNNKSYFIKLIESF